MLVMKTWPASPLSEFSKVNTNIGFLKKGRLKCYLHSQVMNRRQVIKSHYFFKNENSLWWKSIGYYQLSLLNQQTVLYKQVAFTNINFFDKNKSAKPTKTNKQSQLLLCIANLITYLEVQISQVFSKNAFLCYISTISLSALTQPFCRLRFS